MALLRAYYYLAPLWWVLESAVAPGVRAGMVTDGSWLGNAGFYGFESAIGLGLFFRWRAAEVAALSENVLYLAAAVRYIVIAPMDIAMAFDGNAVQAAAMGHEYRQAIPGLIYSGFHVVYNIQALTRKNR